MTQGVQTSYENKMAKAYPGLIADLEPKVIRSKAAEGNVAFGLAVELGTDPEKQVKVAEGGAATGISVRDLAHENDSSGVALYSDEEAVAYMQEGFIYCSIDGTGNVGDGLTYVTTSGQLSTAAVDGTHIAIRAQLEEACAVSGDICLVRVNILPAIGS